jgi:hypothetical protein
LCFADGTTSATTYEGYIQYNHNTDSMQFATGHTERMRIASNGDTTHIASYSSSTTPFRVGFGTYASFTPTFLIDDTGSVLVGKTSDNFTDAGHVLFANGAGYHIRDGGFTTAFKRLTDDGEILRFYKDSTQVGSIGSTSGVISHIILDPRSSLKGAGILGASIDANTGIIQPCDRAGAVADNAINLGSTSNRWKNLYLGGGIYLGGTGSDNFLDDYEEGTWTPVYTPANNSFTTMTMNVVSATYTKIGRQVTARAYITTNEVVVGTASGGLNIDGLPFTSASGNDGFSSVSIGYVTNWGTVPNTGYVRSNNTEIRLRRSTGANDSSPSDLTTGATANQNQIMITATYFV